MLYLPSLDCRSTLGWNTQGHGHTPAAAQCLSVPQARGAGHEEHTVDVFDFSPFRLGPCVFLSLLHVPCRSCLVFHLGRGEDCKARLPPLPRAAHPRGRRKAGKKGTHNSPGQVRPLLPSCRLRASPRALSDGVALGLQPRWGHGRMRKEERKAQTVETGERGREKERRRGGPPGFVMDHQETTRLITRTCKRRAAVHVVWTAWKSVQQ